MQAELQIPQLQAPIPLQNNYVYITECNPSISTIQDVSKQFGNEVSSVVAAQPIQSNGLTYNLNSMGILDGLTNNGYAIQHLNIPATAVQYQTFNVPMLNQANGLVQPITGEFVLLTNPTPIEWINYFSGSFNSSSSTNRQRN